MGIMVVNQGDDPIVVILRSDRGTLELTEKQCAAIRAAGTPQEALVGERLLNTPQPPRVERSVPYWTIHDCIIDQNGFWRGGSHDMTRAVLSAIGRNPALFAREALDAAHATGFRDGAADREKRSLAHHATLAESNAALKEELEKVMRAKDELAKQLVAAQNQQMKASELLNAEGHDPRNGLVEQVKNLIDYTASVERERDAALDTISKQKSDYDTLSEVLASKTKECQEAQDDLRSTREALIRFQTVACNTDRAVVALVEGREPNIQSIPNGCLKIHLAQLQAKLAAALGPDKDAEAFASALGKDRDAARADAARLQTEVAKLQGFKQLVHERLDQMKVPTFDGETCRVAARLGFLQQEMTNLRDTILARVRERTDVEEELAKVMRAKDELARLLVAAQDEANHLRADPADRLRVQLDAIITSTQPFLHTVAALIRNHPVLGDGMGVGQLANGAETASLWRELYSTWRRLTDLRASEHLVKDRCDAPAGARTGG